MAGAGWAGEVGSESVSAGRGHGSSEMKTALALQGAVAAVEECDLVVGADQEAMRSTWGSNRREEGE